GHGASNRPTRAAPGVGVESDRSRGPCSPRPRLRRVESLVLTGPGAVGASACPLRNDLALTPPELRPRRGFSVSRCLTSRDRLTLRPDQRLPQTPAGAGRDAFQPRLDDALVFQPAQLTPVRLRALESLRRSVNLRHGARRKGQHRIALQHNTG